MTNDGKVGVIIVAAGKSRRMGGRDKLFAPVGGVPLLARVLDCFQECRAVDEIVVVLGDDNLEQGRKLVAEHGWSKVSRLCLGGIRRQDSARKGIEELSDCRWVVIHDGARPMVDADLIEKGLAEAALTGAAVAGVPVKDTIKTASAEGFVQGTPQREGLWVAQTPQVFRFDLIKRAHEEISENVSDDAMMVEKLGGKVKLYMGSYKNIKITTPEDLALAEIIVGYK
ncbi:MAG: 2-C-methyl-D-erythritol 4-phosphate cytidylyltransferase [Dehalococcoidia bacterium]